MSAADTFESNVRKRCTCADEVAVCGQFAADAGQTTAAVINNSKATTCMVKVVCGCSNLSKDPMYEMLALRTFVALSGFAVTFVLDPVM